jgi:hypothetical protein
MPQKMVMNCLTRSDETWVVELTLSGSILDDLPFKPLLTATVSIYENDILMESVVNTPDFEGRYFFEHSYPVPGNTYRIEATASPFQTITANFIHPLPVELDSLVVTILGASPEFKDSKDVVVRVYFTDPPGENYYGVKCVFKSEDVQFPQYTQSFGLILVDPAYSANGNGALCTLMPTFSDAHFDGTSAFIDFKTLLYERPDAPSIDFCTVTLVSLTKDYYNYLRAANLQNSSRQDPLAQTVPVKGNIENGFGIFAGFAQTLRTQAIAK